MACKMEEIISPKVTDFVKATDNGYSKPQIVKIEKVMTKRLKWLLAPPTPYLWISWYMLQWDAYLDET